MKDTVTEGIWPEWFTVSGPTLGVIVATVYTFKVVPTGFVPDTDNDTANINLRAAQGTSFYDMDRWVAECYGYRAGEQPLLNPFFLTLDDARTAARERAEAAALTVAERAAERGVRDGVGFEAPLEPCERAPRGSEATPTAMPTVVEAINTGASPCSAGAGRWVCCTTGDDG